ncbi:MAG TPA: MATE family efflux transporter [Tepidisphaeraceae bacterium]|jgi:MATE family multidrug resistance protein
MSSTTTLQHEPSLIGTRSPIAELLFLAGPTVAQMSSYTLMQFADTWMLSTLGTAEPTAAGNGGLSAWSIIGFGVGVMFCVNALVSQHFGHKDYKACGRYLWQGVWFALFFALATGPVIPIAPRFFRLIGHEPHLADLEGTFFRITVAATGIKLASTAFGQFLLAVNRPWIVMLAAFCGVLVNAGANYFLIFGHGGFPRMGVAGAAWGTNIGVTVELLFLMAVVLRPKVRAVFNTADWILRPAQMRTLLSIGLSSGVQLVADIAAWALFQSWVIGRFSTEAMAANMFMFRYLSVSFMPAFGVATAVTALVGRYIGAGRPDLAERRAHLGFLVGALWMLTCGAVYVLGRHVLMRLFTNDPEVLRMGVIVLVFAGIYQLFDAMYIVYNGALRGAGDTFVPAVALAVLCWSITVAGGYVVARWRPDWGLAGPWVMATLYGIILGVFMLLRFTRGRWKTIRLETPEPADKVRNFVPLPEPGATA